MMKRFSDMLLVTLVAAALMQLLCTHLELKYTRETLASELKSEAKLLAMNNERTRRQAEKRARLETKSKVLTAEKIQPTDNGPIPAAPF